LLKTLNEVENRLKSKILSLFSGAGVTHDKKIGCCTNAKAHFL